MSYPKAKKIKFASKSSSDFISTVKKRVEKHFVENNISRYANLTMYFKSFFLIVLLAFLYIVIIFEAASLPVLLVCAMLLGIVSGMVGINISHDALHGAYSPSSLVNRLLGYTYDFVGLSSCVWKITHNYNHHIYTNIAGMDHDIDKAILLRLSAKDKLYRFHYYQNWYIFFLYTLTGLNWIYLSDYLYLYREFDKQKMPYSELVIFFLFKALNFIIFLGIPLMVMTLPWWQILFGYIVSMMAGGITVAMIFQLAHLVENVRFPEPDNQGVIHEQWGVHEMMTTSNFATQNPFVNYICGGLNFQVEHHLFPYLCHVHYKYIAPIVKETAKEFNLPYNENVTVREAIRSHYRLIKRLGRTQKEMEIGVGQNKILSNRK